MRNVEIKAKVRHIDDLINKAKLLSNAEGTVIKQHDTFFKVTQGRLKMRQFEDKSAELLFYERPDTEGPKISSYEKCFIPAESVNGLNNVLLRALGDVGIVKKKRLLFMVGQTRVHVDDVEGLGNFMELEVVLRDDQSLEDGQLIADNLMEQLGVHKEDLLSGAYTDMLQKLNKQS